MSENVFEEIKQLRVDFLALATELRAQQAIQEAELRSIREALLGNQYDKSGVVHAVRELRTTEKSMIEELHDIRADQKQRMERRRHYQIAAILTVPISLALAWLFLAELGVTSYETRVIGTVLLLLTISAVSIIVSAFVND